MPRVGARKSRCDASRPRSRAVRRSSVGAADSARFATTECRWRSRSTAVPPSKRTGCGASDHMHRAARVHGTVSPHGNRDPCGVPRVKAASASRAIVLRMPMKSIRAWLGVDTPEKQEFAPLRETLEALDHLALDRARFLAAFAYLLGRVAHADLHTSTEETRAMEGLVREEAQLEEDQARIVV